MWAVAAQWQDIDIGDGADDASCSLGHNRVGDDGARALGDAMAVHTGLSNLRYVLGLRGYECVHYDDV